MTPRHAAGTLRHAAGTLRHAAGTLRHAAGTLREPLRSAVPWGAEVDRAGEEVRTNVDQEIRFSLPDITDAEVDAVSRVLRSGWITTGSECLQLEEELAELTGAEHVVAVSSCTAALEIAVAHLGLPRGSRIGVPTWTFVSTALAPYHRGVRPVPLDVDEDDFNLSPEALERAIGDLDAVIGVHFGGVPFRKEVRDLCATAGIPLIEDAAHALGASDDRGMVAGQGTAGCCWSFYATKNLTSAEGGALATDDAELAAFARSFRLHGLSQDAWARYDPKAKVGVYDVLGDGLKANLPDVLAALARAQLARFGAMQDRRRELSHRYRAALAALPGVRCVPDEQAPDSADHLMMVILPPDADRTAVRETMQHAGVATSIHFPPLHRFDWFAREGLTPGPGGTPVADRYADRALSLPLHSRLADREVDRVCEALAEALQQR